MTKAVYDTDNNGVVDNSAALNGHADTYFATAAHTHTDEKLLTVEGALTTSTGRLRIYNQMGGTKTIVKVFLSVDVAPTGSPIIVDVHKNGTSVFTTQANRPQIASGANTGQSTSIDVADWAAGEYLTMDVDQIGSGAAGADLTVHIVYTG